MSSMGKREAIEAASSVAKDVAEGRLDPDDLERQAVAECRALFGRVEGPDDPLWELHVDIGRQLMAVGCGWISSVELAEWVAVYRAAEGVEAEPSSSWIEDALAQYDDEDSTDE